LVTPIQSARAFNIESPVLFLPVTNLQLKNYRAVFWLAVTWFLFVTILLCLPGSILPKKNWLDRIFFDKWAHLFLFGLLNFLWSLFFINYSGKKIRYIIIIIIICVLYGTVMEFIQKYFIPNRSFDLGDIVADAAGSLIGGFVVSRQYIKK
jgi:VanZ family protein